MSQEETYLKEILYQNLLFILVILSLNKEMQEK
jgi:hypothetical protein